MQTKLLNPERGSWNSNKSCMRYCEWYFMSPLRVLTHKSNHVSGTLIIIYRNGGVNGTNDTNNVGNMSETNLTERQRFILSTIKANPFVTGKEMSETLSVTQRTIERDLAAMQKAGIIRHEGKVNAGVWVVLEKPQKKDRPQIRN